MINSLNTIEQNSALTFVAGGRSWDQYFNKNLCHKNYTINNVSNLEKVAITPGNFDIFCICTDATKIDDIFTEICVGFDKIMNELNQNNDIRDIYRLKYVSNAGRDNQNKKNNVKSKIRNDYTFYDKNLEKYCPIGTKFSNSDEECVFPECKAIHLELSFEPIKKKKTKVTKGTSFDKKVLLYFEVLYVEDKSVIEDVKNNLLTNCNEESFNYLNLSGLYLFAELISRGGRDKEYDIDLHRKNILEKVLVQHNIDPKEMYLTIITLYMKIFKNRTNFKMKRELLFKNFIEICAPNLINEFSSTITEIMRPYINSFVIYFDDNIKHLDETELERDKFMFVTGGDAYRRYLSDIQQTNDIDTKLYYSKSKDEKTLIELAVRKISELITFLYKHKSTILSEYIPEPFHLGNANFKFDIEFIPIYKDSGQFRIRYIDKKKFKLLSLDFRTKIKIKFSGIDEEIKLNNDIAMLDVVLQKSDLKYKDTVKRFNGLPVASSKYLINDLRTIYDKITENLKSRFHKSAKDRHRFLSLYKYFQSTQQLLTSRTNSKLKRKLDDILEDIGPISIEFRKIKPTTFKRNKQRRSSNTPDMYYNNTFGDIINNNTLDKHIGIINYTHIIDSLFPIINVYYDTIMDKIKENKSKSVAERKEKLLLSFDDIKNIYNSVTSTTPTTETTSTTSTKEIAEPTKLADKWLEWRMSDEHADIEDIDEDRHDEDKLDEDQYDDYYMHTDDDDDINKTNEFSELISKLGI